MRPRLEIVAAVAQLAPNRKVRLDIDGTTHVLPRLPAAPPPEVPNPLETAAQTLMARDLESRASTSEFLDRVAGCIDQVKAAVTDVANGQAAIAANVTKLEGTLHLPVKPIYDAGGQLIGAQRVTKLGANNAG